MNHVPIFQAIARARRRPSHRRDGVGCASASDNRHRLPRERAAKDTFNIKDEKGKEYKLTSTTVKLEPHVGHKVTVEGGATAPDAPLSVTKLTMVNAKC